MRVKKYGREPATFRSVAFSLYPAIGATFDSASIPVDKSINWRDSETNTAFIDAAERDVEA
jgi:hypothetical protein